jgi:hypothetical protein
MFREPHVVFATPSQLLEPDLKSELLSLTTVAKEYPFAQGMLEGVALTLLDADGEPQCPSDGVGVAEILS